MAMKLKQAEQVNELARELDREAADNEHIAKHGSPVTSLVEESQFGAIAQEQRRIAKRLKQIMRWEGV